jgi:alkylation response protein AidB-like acyl-CoA dehydrogenase
VAFEPADRAIDRENRDGWLALALVAVSADAIGVMSSALTRAVDYAKERVQYGVKIGSFQAIQHMCADAFVQIEASASLNRYAAWAVDALACDEALLAARVAKAYSSSVAREVTETVMQVFGGIGQTWEHVAHLHTRRALTDRALFGDESHHLLDIADARLGA